MLTFYVVYALPTIILMYHLDAIRTLIKVPFIIGAVSVTVVLGSVVLHQLEKMNVLYVVMGCKKLNHCLSGSHTPESNESEQPLKQSRCCRILSHCFNYNNIIKQIMLEKQYDMKSLLKKFSLSISPYCVQFSYSTSSNCLLQSWHWSSLPMEYFL